MKKLAALTAILMLSACSFFSEDEEVIVFDTVLGPETKDQIKQLPGALVGDTKNARYTTTAKKGEGMESEDGTD